MRSILPCAAASRAGSSLTRRWLLLAGSSLLLTASAAQAAPKVIVISLDGATPRIVEQYLQDGTLPTTQGVGLLKSKGVFAQQNVTASPSLTAVGHITIATGSTAARTDLAANTFHLTASPFLTTISGFGAPIGGYQINTPAAPTATPNPTAEPIWVALRAAGKKVVAATFPGADGVDVRVPGATTNIVQSRDVRTVDYTIPFGEFNGLGGIGYTLTAANFSAAPSSTTSGLADAGRVSYSPVLQAALEAFTIDGGTYSIQVAALDTTNDGVTNYDTLVFFDTNHGGITAGPFALPSTGPAYVKFGGPSQRFYLEGSTRKSGTAYYLTRLEPDLSTVHLARYSGYDIPRTSADANVIANVDDINNNVGFWGAQPDFRFPERLNSGISNFTDAELEALYQDQVATWTDYQTKVALRSITQNPNADLVLVYSEQPDGSEHQFLLVDPRQPTNPTDKTSIGANQDPAKIARYAGYVKKAYQAANNLVQGVINTVGVDGTTGRPNSDIIVVSDHGFDPFHTSVNLTALLNNAGFATAKVRAVTSGPAANIYINLQGREASGGTPVSPSEYITLQQQIISTLQNFVDANPNYTNGASSVPVFDKIYARPLPADTTDPTFGRKVSSMVGQDFGDVYALMTSGYNFDGTQSPVVQRLGDAASSNPTLSVPNFYGAHGYDPALVDMSAIFYAAGPDITPNATPFTQVRNIDIAPSVARLLGVTPSPLVQGSALPLGPPAPLQLLAAASRKAHGSTGTFDVPLPRTGNPGIECRRAGSGGTHTLVFTFSNALTGGSAAVSGGVGSVSSTSISGRELTVNLANVTDIQTLTVTLSGITDGNASFPSTPISVAFLAGDVNGDRVVNAADVDQVRSDASNANSSTVITSANFRSDVVANGAVNSADAAFTKTLLGHSL